MKLISNQYIKEYLPNGKRVLHDIDNITMISGGGPYSTITMDNGYSFIKAFTLKEFESLGRPTLLVRVHKRYMVKFTHLHSINHYSEPREIIMPNGETIPISRRRYNYIKQVIKQLSK